jgi:probable rRNA maturation factor
MASSRKDQGIVIQITKEFKGTDISNLDIKKMVKAVCNRFGRHEQAETRYEINIVIVGDDEIRKFNRNFLNNEAPTDCISFDLSEDDEEGLKTFELIINGEMAVRQANLRGHSSQAELALYITHGLLHNLGFDDFTKSQARKMHETEDEILQELGYGPVYNKSTKPKEH